MDAHALALVAGGVALISVATLADMPRWAPLVGAASCAGGGPGGARRRRLGEGRAGPAPEAATARPAVAVSCWPQAWCCSPRSRSCWPSSRSSPREPDPRSAGPAAGAHGLAWQRTAVIAIVLLVPLMVVGTRLAAGGSWPWSRRRAITGAALLLDVHRRFAQLKDDTRGYSPFPMMLRGGSRDARRCCRRHRDGPLRRHPLRRLLAVRPCRNTQAGPAPASRWSCGAGSRRASTRLQADPASATAAAECGAPDWATRPSAIGPAPRPRSRATLAVAEARAQLGRGGGREDRGEERRRAEGDAHTHHAAAEDHPCRRRRPGQPGPARSRWRRGR